MSWLDRLLGRDKRRDPELVRRTQEERLSKYQSLKRYARLEGDEELWKFAARKESLMMEMLDDEYDVIAAGIRSDKR